MSRCAFALPQVHLFFARPPSILPPGRTASVMDLWKSLTACLMKLGPRNPAVKAMLRYRVGKAGCSLRYRDDCLELIKGRRSMLLNDRHWVYAPTIAARFDPYFEPLVPRPSELGETLDYSRPTLQTYRQSGLQFELNSFPEEDWAIESYLEWYKPREGDVVYDLGAHCGVSTYHFAKLIGAGGRVIALEPDPLNFALLERNIARHNLTNVVAVQAAVSDVDGTAQFSSEGTIGSTLLADSARASAGNVIDVQVLSFASLIERWGLPAFCKVDIEGAEIRVLSTTPLATLNTHFAVDTDHIVDGRTTDDRIESLFRAAGYTCATAKGTTLARKGDI